VFLVSGRSSCGEGAGKVVQRTATHVSNFDWTGCLAGCEERWGPGGREVDGRHVTLWDPSVVLIQTQQEACGRWKIYTHTTLCTNYAVWGWV
jgi:hypothetical protein